MRVVTILGVMAVDEFESSDLRVVTDMRLFGVVKGMTIYKKGN